MNATTVNRDSAPKAPAAAAAAKIPDASILVDQVPRRWKASRAWAGFTLVLGLVYLTFSFKPIWHTDVWGHLSYGEYLWKQGALPAEEPLLPLAKGMPFVDTAWLSQLVCYGVASWLRLAGLQGITGIVVTAACGYVLASCYAKTRSAGFAIGALGLLLWLDWNQFIVLRPQLFGLVCFTWLLNRLVGKPHRSDWICLPALLCLWTNLHGSYVVGLGLLTAFALGRAVDVLRRTRRWGALTRDGRLCRLVLITELSWAATLINPYGLELLPFVVRFGEHPNLQSLTEWQALDVRTWTGASVIALLAALAVLYRLTPRRVATWEPLVLIGLSAAAFWSARMLTWWAPVAAYLAVLHGHATWRAWRATPLVAAPSPHAGLWTVVVIGLIWIFFGYSSLGLKVIHGKDSRLDRAVSQYTPVGAVAYLRTHPPKGQVFNVYEWGDYLQWAGPEGMRVFVNSHAHVVPKEVWQHYLQVIQQSSGWQEVLDRYDVTTIVLDRAVREHLIKALKDDERWQVGYEDHVAAIFVRRKETSGE
jgi:hypothetical protein